jgi:hypothetical protein
MRLRPPSEAPILEKCNPTELIPEIGQLRIGKRVSPLRENRLLGIQILDAQF